MESTLKRTCLACTRVFKSPHAVRVHMAKCKELDAFATNEVVATVEGATNVEGAANVEADGHTCCTCVADIPIMDVIHIAAGEDIASKILAFSQQKNRALCIMSGSGSVSSVTLRRPAPSVGNVTYEGPFEILSLSGHYVVPEMGGARLRIGGVNVSLSGSDGSIIGAR